MQILVAYFPREIYFMVAAVSTKNKYLNFFMRLMNIVATRRPQDEAVSGEGVIVSIEGNTLKGKGTKFTKVLGEKYMISMDGLKKTVVVNRVIDDELVVLENNEGEKQARLAAGEEKFNVIPKLDQKESYDTSWSLLKAGKVFGIFPEVLVSTDSRVVLTTKPGFYRSKLEWPSFTWGQLKDIKQMFR